MRIFSFKVVHFEVLSPRYIKYINNQCIYIYMRYFNVHGRTWWLVEVIVVSKLGDFNPFRGPIYQSTKGEKICLLIP